MHHEHTFQCPLPNGLHARPASRLAEVAIRFAAEITLVNEASGVTANAKSALSIVAADVRLGDACRLQVAGADANAALAALRDFVSNELPGCDEALPTASGGPEVVLPRPLRQANVRWLAGTVVCPGIGQGVTVLVGGLALPAELATERAGSVAEETRKIAEAVAAVRAGLETKLATGATPVEEAILRAHLSIVEDIALREKLTELGTAGQSAGQAIVDAARFFADRLRAAQSIYVRERAADIEDIGLQLLEHVHGGRRPAAEIVLTAPSVVVAENLTPRQLLSLDRALLQALVLEHAGATSHAEILARSFNVPTLTGVAEVRANLPPGREIIVDANCGIVIPEVAPPVQRYYERERRTLQRRQQRLARYMHAPATTRDGQRMEVAANVATADELAPAFAQGADGIGLFRTEMLFMDCAAPPTEDEQLAVYVQAARTAQDRPVIIRTIDIGGDKPVPYLNLPEEANPFLGYRGVRIYAEHRELVAAQLRAILRASAFGKVWLMVPMIAALDEVLWIKTELARLQEELTTAGIAFDPHLPVGIMVETPAAAMIIDQLATAADFFSIGTNDLTQYLLAVDRDSDRVADLYSARHPAVLRVLAKIVTDAHAAGRWVGMCGEMTRSPRNLPLLIGLGLDEISTAAPEIPAVKAMIAELSAAECRGVLEQTLACRSVAEVEQTVAASQGRRAGRSLLDLDCITVGSDSARKEEAIQEIVDAFYAGGRTEHRQAVEDAVWAREAVYSTGLGHGFAIPHCKTDAIAANSIGVVRLRQPIDWGAVDGEPVHCVILLAIRESDPVGAHMQVFSKLARKLMHAEFRDRLLAAGDRAAILNCLKDELGLAADANA